MAAEMNYKQNQKQVADVVATLMANSIRFYLDNNTMSGYANLTLHDENIGMAGKLFPELVQVREAGKLGLIKIQVTPGAVNK
jgi:hypothetical protein